MFTGIVEAVGTLVEVKSLGHGCRVRIETPLATELAAGDSLAVNGVCLTATLTSSGEVHADIGPETARVTTLGSLQHGCVVNLERPMRLNGRLDGHLVSGHVDGVGIIDEIRRDEESYWFTVGFPGSLAPFFIHKGSVAVDGVSLTVAGLGQRQFDAQIIPFTLSATTLGRARVGERVNLECDMIGKYVIRAMELSGQGRGRGISSG